jgi:ATP-dependent DNA helicase RecG
MAKRFSVGQRVLLRGKAKLHAGRFQLNHPKVTTLDEDVDVEETSQLLPVYRLTDGISQLQMRAIVDQVVQDFAGLVQEAFPESLRQHADVCDITSAIRQIHAPKTQAEIDEARGRLVYQELLILQLALAVRRHRTRAAFKAPALELTPKIRSRILGRLPFELTDSQQTALHEIAANMSQPFPMNRLLHGEVGSGKTVVAVCAMMLAVAHGYQAAIMAPTEILARQHYFTLRKLLGNSRVKLGLWIGSLKGAERKKLKTEIESGETVGRRSSLLSHDGDPDPSHDVDDTLWRSRRFDVAANVRGRATCQHLFGYRIRTRTMVAVCCQETSRRSASVHRRAAGRVGW